MQLLFLGTSSGVPTRRRNVSGLALLESEGRAWHLVDCGEGTQQQLLRAGLSLQRLRCVCITHVHGDHCFGLPGLLASAAMQGRTQPLTLLLPPGLYAWLQATLQLSQSHLPYPLEVHECAEGGPWEAGELQISSTPLSHRVPCWAYRLSERCPAPRLDVQRLHQDAVPRGPAWGELARGADVMLGTRRLRAADYRLPGRPPHTVVVAGDNDRPDLLAEACRGADVLVHEATYTQALAEQRPDYGHSGAASVARFAAEAGLANLVLTHFSARYAQPGALHPLHAEACAHYAGRLFLAEDLLRLRLDRDGLLQPMDDGASGAPHEDPA